MLGLVWGVKICYLNAFSILQLFFFFCIKKLRIFYSIYFNVFSLGTAGWGRGNYKTGLFWG